MTPRPIARPERPQTADEIARDVFDHFPYALLVLDRDGVLEQANELAAAALGRGLEPGSVRCCELFRCGAPGTPLAGGCLTRIALDQSETLPEVRIELPGSDALPAAWVTASRLSAGGSRVAVQLRPGEAHDRRRGNVLKWTGGWDVRVHGFGQTRVEGPSGPLGGKWLAGRTGQVFKFLLCERHRLVPAEEIVENVWRESDERTAGNLRYYVHQLRSHLEPQRSKGSRQSLIVSRQGAYGLDLSRMWVDADAFEHHVRAGLLALRRDALEAAGESLARGIDLYTDEFLADERYAGWAFAERDRLRSLASDALRALTEIAARRGDRDGVG
jgi:hypothetical protein